MKERRQFARFNIQLPVKLEAITSDNKEVLDLETRDISYSGAFIPTLTPFPEGTRFTLDFTIPTDKLKRFKDISSLKACMGSMVRSAPHGLAIQFDRECTIKGLKAL
jgi:PilZ domain